MINEWNPSHGAPQCRCVYAAIEVAADPARVAETAQSNEPVCLTMANGSSIAFTGADESLQGLPHLEVPYTEEEDEAWKALDAKR